MANKFRVDSEELRARLRTLFGDELRIDRELGRGGMAAVFLAYDPGLERQVAVKLLLPDVSVHSDVVERFLREARTVAALQHPHIVTVYGVRSRDDAHAIVMQFVEGMSLDTLVAEQGAVPPAQAARMLSQVAAGLQHAHDRGVVHRDVKPANVLVDDQGNAYVTDFGIARRNDGAIVTKTGLVLGSWDYMSPEQRAGERVTASADQYAFGVMAFEVFTGRLPFPGTPAEVIRGHMETPAPSLRAVVPELTPAIDALIARMLAKDPDHRWPSLAEARQRLDELAEGRTSGAFGVVSASTSRATLRAIAIGAIVVLLAAVAAWAFGLFGQSAPEVSNPTPGVSPPGVSPPATATPEPPVAARGGLVEPRTRPVVPQGPSVAPAPSRGPAAAAADSVTPPSPAPEIAAPGVSVVPPAATTTAAVSPAATTADARRMGREFVTLLNQRQGRAIAQLAPMGGDVRSRLELLRLVESAPDFAAGFDRLPSLPIATADGFATDFHLDLEWRGGRRRMLVQLFVAQSANGFSLSGFSVVTID